MRARIGTVPVEITRGESAKFHRVLLLVHGFWTDAWSWTPLASYLAHRGWESFAPSLTAAALGDGDAAVDDALAALAATLPEVPIVITHDAGVVPALRLADRLAFPALIAIAPVTASVMPWTSLRARLLRGRRVPPPTGARARAFLGSVASAHAGRLVAESGSRLRAIAAGGADAVRPSAAPPGVALSGDADAVAPPDGVAAFASRVGWTTRRYAGRGHFPHLEPGFEQIADDVHRWIVRTLGADLLALLDESEDR